jgi:hypothetical protein
MGQTWYCGWNLNISSFYSIQTFIFHWKLTKGINIEPTANSQMFEVFTIDWVFVYQKIKSIFELVHNLNESTLV